MSTPTIGMLAVPGASIYYEVRGSGPALLLISTGNGDATPFGAMADKLAERFTVISYDRRGFSRSLLDGPVNENGRLYEDADDARRLLEHLGDGPGYVMGTCSGGIVALAMMQRHPEHIAAMVVHEPPLVSVLPDAQHWLTFHAELYNTYRTEGADAARPIFRTYAGLDGDTRPPPEAELPEQVLADLLARLRENQIFWYEHELLSYPGWLPDLTALKAGVDRLVLAGGAASREHHSCLPNAVLAEQLGTELAIFPGGHVGHITHPVEYAEALSRVLGAART